MEISIRKIGTDKVNGDESDILNTYIVEENGREFFITCRTHRYGINLGIAGKEGLLYVDSDDNRVHFQVVALGGACALNITDEPVEGLSPVTLRNIIKVDKNGKNDEITIKSEVSQ